MKFEDQIIALIEDARHKTASAESRFSLSWSHYLFLMRMDPAVRQFYEIESRTNNWTLRELERQFNSSLYERLAMSRDKKKVLQLATRGQIVEKPEDALKDPYVPAERQSPDFCSSVQNCPAVQSCA